MPFYAPTVEEVKKLVEAEGSFSVDKIGTFTVDWSVYTNHNRDSRANVVANTIIAVTESLFASTFSEADMDDLFQRLKKRVKERMAQGRSEYLNTVVSMIKMD